MHIVFKGSSDPTNCGLVGLCWDTVFLYSMHILEDVAYGENVHNFKYL